MNTYESFSEVARAHHVSPQAAARWKDHPQWPCEPGVLARSKVDAFVAAWIEPRRRRAGRAAAPAGGDGSKAPPTSTNMALAAQMITPARCGYPDWPALMDVRMLARYLQLSPRKIEELLYDGRFPKPLQLGPRILRWPRAAVDAWVAGLWDTPRATLQVAETLGNFSRN